jgi:DNA-binding MarR family transcriptional regulator
MTGTAVPLPMPPEAGPRAAGLEGVVGFRLRRLQGLFVAHWGRWFRDLEPPVTPVQGGILLLVEDNPGLSQIALARLMKIEPPSLIQALAPLIRAGLVERYRPAGDRRAFALHLSRAGRALAEEVRAGIAAQERDLLAHLDETERRTLLALLDRALQSGEAALAIQPLSSSAEPSGPASGRPKDRLRESRGARLPGQ